MKIVVISKFLSEGLQEVEAPEGYRLVSSEVVVQAMGIFGVWTFVQTETPIGSGRPRKLSQDGDAERILAALKEGGSIQRAAEILGVTSSTLARAMKAHSIVYAAIKEE